MEAKSGKLGDIELIMNEVKMGASGWSRLTVMIVIAVIAGLLMPRVARAASADGQGSMASLKVLVEPEYDDPRVLVVVEPVLSADTPLPHKARFDIPKSAVNVGMACELVDGQHKCKIYDTKDKGDYQILTYNADTSRELFLEYYYDPLAGQKTEKSFVYEYRAAYDVKHLEIAIQQPLKAEKYEIDPVAAKSAKDSKGMNVFQYEFDDVPKDRVLTFKVSYTKSDPSPSVPRVVAPVAAPAQSADPNPGGLPIWLGPAILGVIGVGVIFAVAWRMTNSEKGVVAIGPESKPKARPKGAPIKSTLDKICANCGGKLGKGVRSCPSCGSDIDESVQ